MAKFEVGTWVRVRSDISSEEMCRIGRHYFTDEMRRFQGKIYKIEEIKPDGTIHLEGVRYHWDPPWFENICKLNRGKRYDKGKIRRRAKS